MTGTMLSGDRRITKVSAIAVAAQIAMPTTGSSRGCFSASPPLNGATMPSPIGTSASRSPAASGVS